jgi:hypothetical protein
MNDGKWGHCRSCKFFGSPARVPLSSEEARCGHPELSKYHLTIFGASGCSGWELRPGLPKQIEDQPAQA